MINIQTQPNFIPTPSQNSAFSNLSNWKDKFFKYFKILVTIGLAIQGLIGFYTSAKFILIEHPLLEKQLALGQITKEQVKDFTSQEIINIISALISLFFALRIATVQHPLAKKVNTGIGVILFFANAYLKDFLNNLDYFDKLEQFILNLTKLRL